MLFDGAPRNIPNIPQLTTTNTNPQLNTIAKTPCTLPNSHQSLGPSSKSAVKIQVTPVCARKSTSDDDRIFQGHFDDDDDDDDDDEVSISHAHTDLVTRGVCSCNLAKKTIHHVIPFLLLNQLVLTFEHSPVYLR